MKKKNPQNSSNIVKTISRRDFCKNLSKGVMTGVVLSSIPGACGSVLEAAGGSVGIDGRVVKITNPAATDGSGGKDNANLVYAVIKNMLDVGVKAFTGSNSTRDAWSAIIPDPSKRVAIKVNCENMNIYTKYRVVQGIIAGLLDRGVSPNNVVVYDRNGNGFGYAGFVKNTGQGVKVGIVDELGGYSNESGLYGMANLLCGRSGLYDCDYLINVPCLKALDFDGVAGVTLGMKNHFGTCQPDHHDIMNKIPFYNTLPDIKNKTRLIVLDAIMCSYKFSGGERYQEYIDISNTLFLATDPVAVDYLGWRMIEQHRTQHGWGPISPVPTYIHKAAVDYHLGTDNPADMEVIEPGSSNPPLSVPQELEML